MFSLEEFAAKFRCHSFCEEFFIDTSSSSTNSVPHSALLRSSHLIVFEIDSIEQLSLLFFLFSLLYCTPYCLLMIIYCTCIDIVGTTLYLLSYVIGHFHTVGSPPPNNEDTDPGWEYAS